ncbi:MAG: biotin--[acetyl-CoA-carboxylase] ligase, partial [Acidimicrobiales bacterium]
MSGPPRFVDVQRVVETGSTNSDLLALARQGAPEGTVLVADHQTAGRGRMGRTWEAPPGSSLLVSVLLRPPVEVADLVTMVAGLAMADAVGPEVRLKWPNDLVIDDRKLAGLLAEADWSGGGQSPAVVVGIGVNVAWAPEGAVACGGDREELLASFLTALDARYGELVATGDRAAVLAAWRTRSATLGRRVRVQRGGGEIEGTAV